MRTFASLLGRDDDTRAARPAAPRLAVWTVIAAASTAGGAFAQGSVPCTAIANDAERLACYDRALRPSGAPPLATAAPAPTATADPTLSTSDRRAERRIRESTATTAPAAPMASAAPAAPPSRTINPGSNEIVPLVIVNVRALPGREMTFTDDDGVRWVQTDSQRIRPPEAPFDAELKPGAMGSYFLVPKELGRGVRVRQVR